jgi:eukaryotic-like serine/threonine-protein kinase
MTASPSVIRRARAVFQCALELEGAEREEFVRDACSGDEALLDFVHSLLAADLEEGSSFTFATDVVRPSVRHAADERPSSPLPEGFAHVRELGIGGSGRVELCRDRSNGALVAIKVIDLRGLGQGGVDRVRREWRILSSVVHPALVRLRSAGTLEDRYAYLVMEFVDGLDIRSHVEVGMLDASAVAELMLPVAEALSLAHGRGVIHRDIKPSNILIDPDGRARLLDFGAARIAVGGAVSIHHHTLTGEMVGTLTYMSPEQAAGRPSEVDGRTDVYQLATVLYELIEGRPPFELDGLTLAETISAIVSSKPRPMSRPAEEGGASPALARVIMKALAKKPAGRQRSMKAFASSLRRALDSSKKSARLTA